MGTRSLIGIANMDKGGVDFIYCHWDGYPEWNGKVLVDHYRTPEKIRQLIALGDISTLQKDLPTEALRGVDDRWGEITKPYHLWRGEELVIHRDPNTLEFMVSPNTSYGEEYRYYYSMLAEQWLCYDVYEKKFVDLYQTA